MTTYCKFASCPYNKSGLYCDKLILTIDAAGRCEEIYPRFANSERPQPHKQEMQKNGFRCEDTKDDCRTGEIEEPIIRSNETESEEKSGCDVEQE